MYYIIISFVPGVTAFVWPKVAVTILLARILNPGQVHKAFMWIASVLYVLMGAIMLVINFAQCTPAAAQWGGAPGVCWDRKITVDYSISLGVVSAVFDFYLAIYPTIVLFSLQMNWKKKLALSLALGFGYWYVLATCVTSCHRIHVANVWPLSAGAITIYKCYTLTGLLDIVDFTYSVDDVILWTK